MHVIVKQFTNSILYIIHHIQPFTHYCSVEAYSSFPGLVSSKLLLLSKTFSFVSLSSPASEITLEITPLSNQASNPAHEAHLRSAATTFLKKQVHQSKNMEDGQEWIIHVQKQQICSVLFTWIQLLLLKNILLLHGCSWNFTHSHSSHSCANNKYCVTSLNITLICRVCIRLWN